MPGRLPGAGRALHLDTWTGDMVGKYKDSHGDAKLPERAVPICLQGNLVADWEAADRELKRANDTRSDSLEGAGTDDLVDRVRALEAEMLEHTEQYRLRALPRHKFRKLVGAYPPRTGEDGETIREDAVLQVNREAFFPALIRACLVDPDLDDDDWIWLLGNPDDEDDDGVLTDRQFGDLADAAWFLNRGEVDVPFSHAASLARRNSGDE